MRSIFRCLLLFFSIYPQVFAVPLIIATSVFDPPFETASDNKGHYFGFEIDLMSEICKRIHEQCQFKGLTFEQVLSQTLSGEADLAIDAISITTERLATYLFSLPYMTSAAQVLTVTDSKVTALKEVDGKSVGVVAGTAFRELAQDEFNGVNVITYKNQADLFQAIVTNEVDLIILDKYTAQYWVNNNGNLFRLVGGSIEIGTGFGIMSNMSHAKLIERINKALIEIESDGTYVMIYGRYF